MGQKPGGLFALAQDEKQEAEIGDGIGVGGCKFEGATKGLFGKTELHDGSIVPEIGGFALMDRFREASGRFHHVSLGKQLDSEVETYDSEGSVIVPVMGEQLH